MATARVKTIKQVTNFWKAISLSNGKQISSSSSSLIAPLGFLPVYIGWTRTRFLIPTRFLNFPIFVALLEKSGEEFGFKVNGGMVLPCDVEFFKHALNLLQKDEKRYGSLELKEFLKISHEACNFDYSSSIMCKKEGFSNKGCDHRQGLFRPLLLLELDL